MKNKILAIVLGTLSLSTFAESTDKDLKNKFCIIASDLKGSTVVTELDSEIDNVITNNDDYISNKIQMNINGDSSNISGWKPEFCRNVVIPLKYSKYVNMPVGSKGVSCNYNPPKEYDDLLTSEILAISDDNVVYYFRSETWDGRDTKQKMSTKSFVDCS